LNRPDWHAVQQAMKQRIHLMTTMGLVVEQLRCITEGKARMRIFAARERALHPFVTGLPALRDCGELFQLRLLPVI
jgi:isocitrate dehydrogenase kinase/phosphatase